MKWNQRIFFTVEPEEWFEIESKELFELEL